ncbi:hypothetical protein BC829DRAFT_486682 [Chytridium lagenaria]|nr:hypothetical protein BC829DRAFT_486682 [Chytridium lagenaria]
MRVFFTITTILIASLMTTRVIAHGLVTQVTGANGVTGTGFGLILALRETAHNVAEKPFSLGVWTPLLKFRNNWDIGGGQLPSTGANGMLTMTYHQVNADGAGPLTAEVDTTGTGTNWQRVQVVQNAPGRFGLNRATATTDQTCCSIPANMKCTAVPTVMLASCVSKTQLFSVHASPSRTRT